MERLNKEWQSGNAQGVAQYFEEQQANSAAFIATELNFIAEGPKAGVDIAAQEVLKSSLFYARRKALFDIEVKPKIVKK